MGFVFLVKPYFLDAGLSEVEREETEDVFNTIIDQVHTKPPIGDVEETDLDASGTPQEVSPDLNSETSSETLTSDKLVESDSGVSDQGNETSNPEVVSKDPLETKTKTENEMKAEKIYTQYFNAMSDIRLEAETLLNELIGEAKFEYGNLSLDEKEDLLVTGKLASKYMARASELEKIVDGAVERLLANMKADLRENGLSTVSVGSLQEQYESEKKARRELLLTKALNY